VVSRARFSGWRRNIVVLVTIAAVAAALSTISYQYSTNNANGILKIASQDVRSNAEIQAHDVANNLVNKVDAAGNNLQILARSPAVLGNDVKGAIPLFSAAQQATSDFTSSYFWVGKDGKLLWADGFTNTTLEQNYNGEDRSYRKYYSEPRDTLKPYYSSLVESVDGIPRLYVAYPILGNNDARTASEDNSVTTNGDFRGVIVTSIDLDDLGKFLQGQLSSKFESQAGILDRNGLILYSNDATYIGKDVFGPEFQATLPIPMKDSFNDIMRESLKGEPGLGDITYQGKTSTIAYEPVSLRGNDFAILYIVSPHNLPTNVSTLIDQQRIFTTVTVVAISAIAIAIAFFVLKWNKRLSDLVEKRTAQLMAANVTLAEANEQLEAHEKMQREFINIAAHELRTPTQAILGYAELFSMSPEHKEEAIKAMTRNAHRLERLTNDILDVARIEGNLLRLGQEKFSIEEVISSAVEDSKRLVANRNVKFVHEKGVSGLIVDADKGRVTQVITNLINNAVKFTNNGTISVRADQNGDEVLISVRDTGTGIDPEIMPRLFSKFASRSQSGTGLGLFISKSIVEAHGGRIWGYNNKNGQGATFSFSLPLVEIQEKKSSIA